MPIVVIQLEDTPTGGVSIKSEFQPRVGNPLSPAQSAALEIIRRTRHEWKVTEPRSGHNPIKCPEPEKRR